MWKYILASTLLVVGIVEIVLALHKGLREALMQASLVRVKPVESSMFLVAGISALVTGLGLLFYGLFL
ncbi:MAG: hypothetical protein DMF69_14450 [Acidobacteria bacterium]|nr:MAG: hypothetical protein DMF69_14450 [Acidobacteriota bacterium]